MRLYDDIMRDKDIPHTTKDLLDGCIVVVGDNVASYYYEGTDKEYWDLSDFPNIAPPFGRFWLDFKAPKQSISVETGTQAWGLHMPSYWGVHCQATQVDEANEMVKTEEGRETIKSNLLHNISELQASLERQRPDVYTVAQSTRDEEEARARFSPEHFTMLTQLMNMIEVYQEIQAGNWERIAQVWATAEGAYKWVMDVTLFQKLTQGGKEVIWGPMWAWRLFITDVGQVAHDPLTQVPLSMSSPQSEDMRNILETLQERGMKYEEAWALCSSSVNPFFHTAMLAISFMHCHNVSLDSVTPPKHVVHSKSAKRRGERDYQPVTFKTLDIRPMREVLKRAEGSAPQGDKTARALHICRGHFRHYQEGRGLFGKYAGTFWVPMHVRGEKTQGTTVKDYRIKL